MNEPKKRGRPSKAEIAAREAKADVPPEVALIQAEMRAGLEIAAIGSTQINPAQEYALRIWNKQSVSLSRHERVGRIAAALKEQGLSMEGVELP